MSVSNLVVTVINLIDGIIENLNHERQPVHDLVLVKHVLQPDVGDVIEDAGEQEQRTVATDEWLDALTQPDTFIPYFTKQTSVVLQFSINELHLQPDNLIPLFE